MSEPNRPEETYLFTPVQPTRVTANGWTAEAQIAFVAALARTGVVAVAARSVGKSPRSAYQLRARAGAESFARAWDDALSEGQMRAMDAVLSRSFEPRVVPILYRGRQVGTREIFDNGLAIAALRALDGANGRWSRGTPVNSAYDGSPAEYLASSWPAKSHYDRNTQYYFVFTVKSAKLS